MVYAVCYVGMWLCGVLHDEGEMVWADGRRQQGTFRNNQLHGMGREEVTTAAGVTVTEGNWQQGKLNGWGRVR